ncbi:hypothetical protein Tco_1155478 [Tanacetum coccineum]
MFKKPGNQPDIRKGLKRQKEAKMIKNRQGTKETRTRVKKQPKIKAGSTRHSNKGSQRTNEFPHCPCLTCARCGSNRVNGDCFNCSTYSSANNYSPNLYTTPPHFSDYSCHDGEGNTPHDLQDNSCVALCSYCRGSHEDYCCTQLWCENGYPICESCGNDAHYGYPCPSFVPDPCYNRNFDCFPHDSQTLPQQYQTPPVASMEMLHAQTDLIRAMQHFLKKYDHIPHNEKSIKLLLAEEKFLKIKQVVEEEQTQPEYLQELLQNLLKDLQILNEIQPLRQETPNQIQKDQEEKSIAELLAEERLQKANQALNENKSPQEMRIQDLEIQKQQCLEEIKEWMNDLGRREYQKEEIDIDYRRKCEDKIYELKDKFNGLSIEIRKIIQESRELRESEARVRSQKIIIDDDDDDLGFYAVPTRMTIHTPICVDDDDTDDDDDYDDDFYDCVDIEEDGGEIDLDISKIVDISLREKLVKSYLLIEKINAFSLSPPIPISPIFCPSSTIPVVDFDLPLEEADVPSFSDDSMILSEYESFTFDDEPVMAEVNVFDEINTSELSYPGIGENVVLDEEEDTFTFTTRSFLPFVTYPEVLPASYSTGSEDKIFKPGIFDNVLTRKSSLTLDVFDPLHPPLMDFHVTKAFSGFTFSLLKLFSKKFFEPGIKNATVFRILEDSWFNIVEGQSNAHNFH